jgi:type IV pilus assembly protein PilX
MNRIDAYRRQGGVALSVVLILLVVMTLLALASMRGTLLEEKMSSNVLDRELQFQAAEAALREGEAVASTRPMPAAGTGCVDGICSKPDPTVAGDTQRWLAPGFWGDASGKWKEATVNIDGQATKPRFIVELLDDEVPNWPGCDQEIPINPSCLTPRYRVTARSTAPDRAEVILQSNYAAP